MTNEHRPRRDALRQRILTLVSTGQATSRIALARELGMAASTISAKVQELISADVLIEDGQATSTGGRRARILRLRDASRYVLVTEFGANHARIGVSGMAGQLLRVASIPIDVSRGPEITLREVADGMVDTARALAQPHESLAGVGVAVPGPVRGSVVLQASRMPGWSGFDISRWFTDRFGVPTAVDNDANLMALGEHRAQLGSRGDSITVKAGTAIGTGIIIDGAIHRGATSAAGDITHTRIEGAGDAPCSCGNRGCLETVASGAGIMRQLREQGRAPSSTAEAAQLVRDGDPTATTLVRSAGNHLGEVLSVVVNFMNPEAVFLTGGLSSLDPFLAAVRSRVYEGCHPLITQSLRIDSASTGADAGLLGATEVAWEMANLLP